MSLLLVLLVLLVLLLGPARAVLASGDLVDPRDGRTYPTVEIAGMTWLGANLAFAAPGSFCFRDDEALCGTLGRLYPWEVALRACPRGWHLSTEEEWQRLERHLGMTAADVLQTRGRGAGVGVALQTGGASGLGIPLAGWRDPDGVFHEGNGNDRAAALWTATEAEPDTAWHRDVSSARSVVWRSPVDKPYSLSVRCVQDSASGRPP